MCDSTPIRLKVGEDPTLHTNKPRPERKDSQAAPRLSVIGDPHKGDFALKSPPITTPLPGETARTASPRSPKKKWNSSAVEFLLVYTLNRTRSGNLAQTRPLPPPLSNATAFKADCHQGLTAIKARHPGRRVRRITGLLTDENHVSRKLRRRLSRQIESRATPPQVYLQHVNASHPESWRRCDFESPPFLPGTHPTPAYGSLAGDPRVRRPHTDRTRLDNRALCGPSPRTFGTCR